MLGEFGQIPDNFRTSEACQPYALIQRRAITIVERMNATQFLPLTVLATRLGLPASYLRRLANQAKIPSLRVNGRVRFDEGAVRDALHQLSLGGGRP